MTNPQQVPAYTSPETLPDRYQRIRRTTADLAAPLAVEDMVVQSMPDASPTRWHLAHTTWFFEHFLLAPRLAGHAPYRAGWNFLFNSYYYTVGDMHSRPDRGLLSRPTVAEILEYRAHVDERMAGLMAAGRDEEEFRFLVELGLNHEQQHQELILTDIKHALSLNPLKPAYREDCQLPAAAESPLEFHESDGGIVEIGATPGAFCFDNETPRHRVLLQPFALGSRLVTNAEYRSFIEDGGYRHSEWWLSDGWARTQAQRWERPIYWAPDLASEFTLLGEVELDPNRAVCHLSYFEADAYARWAGARLPSEAEWEHVAGQRPPQGNLLDQQRFHPGGGSAESPIAQLYGDAWEWTRSAYSAYPGFRPLGGSLGEYNGKFMCSQLVLRGGSCATPADHIRASYRNFFYPDARWQFSGIRLARDA
jgi:ergothioneine biosynthesis protein EgtB